MLPESWHGAITAAVRTFEAFDPDNAPDGEHDFDAVDVAGVRSCRRSTRFGTGRGEPNVSYAPALHAD